jgi:putative MATE family efflux protein
MTDLTRGPIGRHLAGMAGFIGGALVFQAAYFIVDLYFVSHIGPQAVAGVSASGNFSFLSLAAAQLVGVGSLSLIAQAVGRRDDAYANLVFNQVCGLSLLMAAVMLVGGYLFAGAASAGLGADPASAAYGRAYLYGFLPSMACMYPATAIGSALRATGVVRPTVLLQTASVLINALLAPVLIVGWGTGHGLGAFGAGLASSIAAGAGLAGLVAMVPRVQRVLHADRTAWAPRLAVWLSLMRVGLPAAGEFFLMFAITAVVYLCIRRFGADAQAGFGIGSRVMQSVFLPTLAVSFAAAPIAGQNFGARLPHRVAQTFRLSAGIGVAFMLALTALCQLSPGVLVSPFTTDPAVMAVAVQYLRVVSWNFVGFGLVMACGGMFQAFGDTRPSFMASASRVLTFALPAIWLAGRPWATLTDFWWLSVASAGLQACISLLLLRRAFRQKMPAGFVVAEMALQTAP